MALGIISDPGLSKSSQIHQWAEEHGRNVVELIISQRMPSEISGMPMPISETQKMEIFDFDTLLQMKDGDVLFFDEFTNGNIQTLNACLTLIQERRMLSGKQLPDVLIVAAGNPQGSCDMLPQTKQRFMWTHARFYPGMWASYIWKKHKIMPSEDLIRKIKGQYNKGFSGREMENYITTRTAENLIRIAKQIECDDPFWRSASIPSDLCDDLYETINPMMLDSDNKELYFDLMDAFVSFYDSFQQKRPEAEGLLEMAFTYCETAKDIKKIIETLKQKKIAIAYEFLGYISLDKKERSTTSINDLFLIGRKLVMGDNQKEQIYVEPKPRSVETGTFVF